MEQLTKDKPGICTSGANCRYCGERIVLVQGYPMDIGPYWVHLLSQHRSCATTYAKP